MSKPHKQHTKTQRTTWVSKSQTQQVELLYFWHTVWCSQAHSHPLQKIGFWQTGKVFRKVAVAHCRKQICIWKFDLVANLQTLANLQRSSGKLANLSFIKIYHYWQIANQWRIQYIHRKWLLSSLPDHCCRFATSDWLWQLLCQTKLFATNLQQIFYFRKGFWLFRCANCQYQKHCHRCWLLKWELKQAGLSHPSITQRMQSPWFLKRTHFDSCSHSDSTYPL